MQGDIHPTIEEAVRDVRAETPRVPEGPAPSPQEVKDHRTRRLEKVSHVIERMGEHSFIFHNVTEEMARLAESLQEAEEVERIQDPVLRSVTRRVNAFKRGERKVV